MFSILYNAGDIMIKYIIYIDYCGSYSYNKPIYDKYIELDTIKDSIKNLCDAIEYAEKVIHNYPHKLYLVRIFERQNTSNYKAVLCKRKYWHRNIKDMGENPYIIKRYCENGVVKYISYSQ